MLITRFRLYASTCRLISVRTLSNLRGHELALADGLASRLGHRSKLGAITAVIGDLVGDDQMVLRVDRDLHVVADDA